MKVFDCLSFLCFYVSLQYADFRCQRNNIQSIRYESSILDNVCPVFCFFFAVHNEIEMTSVDREVRCHPERILEFTLLGVCMIMPGHFNSDN